MKFVRYKKNKPEYRGIVDGNKIKRINGTIFHDYSLSDDIEDLSNVEILPPINPQKIIGVKANYGKKNMAQNTPNIFIKPASTVTAYNTNIVLPKNREKVCIEGELALIIGKKCKNVSEKLASQVIFGVSIANDVTGVYEDSSLNATLGKSFDTYLPLGPYMVTDIDYCNLNIKTYKNGELVQNGSSKDMIFNSFELVAYISSIMTLFTGDVILTGTPAQAVEVFPNDEITVEIEHLGTLKNKVVESV